MDLIEGVNIKKLKPILDERGYLQECFRSDWSMFEKFGQVYFTVAFPNVVKAWHLHKIQTDNIICISGNGKLVLCDKRKDSATNNKLNEIYFGELNPLLITIPPGIWHGFKAMENKKIMVINVPTEVFNYSEPDEYRLPFNSEEIDYNWDIKMG